MVKMPPKPLHQKISERTANVGVVGLGYVGLPTAVASAGAGFKVTGVDIDAGRVDQINAGHSHVEDVGSDTLSRLVEQEKIAATRDYGCLANMDVIIICVPTPVNSNRTPELGPLRDSIKIAAEHMTGEQLVVLQSTSFAGTTEELVLPQLQQSGRRVGEEFYLAFSPERIDPGNGRYFIHNTPKVVGGVTPRCGEMATAFLSTFVERVVLVSSTRVAEMSKLLENTFRSVNIALANELSELSGRMGIDFWQVIDAASTKPFGFMPFYPGIGVGGHCIPVDPFYLSWKAREYDFNVNFVELAARTNDNRPYYVVSRITDILGARDAALEGSQLLLLGISFKRDIADTRNSPAVRVAEILLERGAKIAYNDPLVREVSIGGCVFRSVELDSAALERPDATVILVDHGHFNWEEIVRHSKLVIDTRHATKILGPRPTVVNL